MKTPPPRTLAESVRQSVVSLLQPDNTRELKPAPSDVWILHQTTAPVVMAECGFLSNPEGMRPAERRGLPMPDGVRGGGGGCRMGGRWGIGFKYFFRLFFWVLRTLCFGWSSCGQLRKYGKWVPAKELCSLDARQPFKKGWTLNF